MIEPEPQLESALEILKQAAPQIAAVRFFKVHAELAEDAGEPIASDDDPDTAFQVDVALRTRQEGNQLGVRLEFEIDIGPCRIELHVAAEYVSEHPFTATEAACIEFANEVGIMTIYPYVREAVSDLTARTIGDSLLLPILARGAMSFGPMERVQDEESSSSVATGQRTVPTRSR